MNKNNVTEKFYVWTADDICMMMDDFVVEISKDFIDNPVFVMAEAISKISKEFNDVFQYYELKIINLRLLTINNIEALPNSDFYFYPARSENNKILRVHVTPGSRFTLFTHGFQGCSINYMFWENCLYVMHNWNDKEDQMFYKGLPEAALIQYYKHPTKIGCELYDLGDIGATLTKKLYAFNTDIILHVDCRENPPEISGNACTRPSYEVSNIRYYGPKLNEKTSIGSTKNGFTRLIYNKEIVNQLPENKLK